MLILFGVNHKTSSIALREQFALSAERAKQLLTLLNNEQKTQEALVLSTCNRSEIYCKSRKPQQLITCLQNFYAVNDTDFQQSIYQYQEQAAVEHLLRVSAGLDSMALGEPQIFGQVKQAYQLAKEVGTVGRYLNPLFQKVFAFTKHIRTQTSIGANPISIAFAVIRLAQQLFSELSSKRVLLIGAGETTQLVARHLINHNIGHITIANRTLAKASILADSCRGQAITFNQIAENLPQVDIVISATSSEWPILGKGAVETALKLRKHKPMLLVDLAVPRDIEPEVGQLSDIYYYTVDDLQHIITKNVRLRQEAAQEAELLVKQKSLELIQTLRSIEASDIIRGYRDSMHDVRDKELEKAMQRLQKGYPTEYIINELARSLTNKLIHIPSTKLKQLMGQEQQDLLTLIKEAIPPKQ